MCTRTPKIRLHCRLPKYPSKPVVNNNVLLFIKQMNVLLLRNHQCSSFRISDTIYT